MGDDLIPVDKFIPDGYWKYNSLFHYREKLLVKKITNSKQYLRK